MLVQQVSDDHIVLFKMNSSWWPVGVTRDCICKGSTTRWNFFRAAGGQVCQVVWSFTILTVFDHFDRFGWMHFRCAFNTHRVLHHGGSQQMISSGSNLKTPISTI